eukprot:g430.t1
MPRIMLSHLFLGFFRVILTIAFMWFHLPTFASICSGIIKPIIDMVSSMIWYCCGCDRNSEDTPTDETTQENNPPAPVPNPMLSESARNTASGEVSTNDRAAVTV